MADLNILNSPYQHTLSRPTEWIDGYTLRNVRVRVRFVPGLPGTGRNLVVSVKGERIFAIKRIGLSNGQCGISWTNLVGTFTHKQGVGVIEHPAAAVVLAGLDNVTIEVDYLDGRPAGIFYGGKLSSMPLMSGTATEYLAAIHQASVINSGAHRNWFVVKEELPFELGNSSFLLEPRLEPGWSIKAINRYEGKHAWWWENQETELFYDTANPETAAILRKVAAARPTNGSWTDWLFFRLLTLGTFRQANFTALHRPWSKYPLHGQPTYGKDEGIHHRMLDLLGDLFFFGGFWQVNLTIVNGSHAATNEFRKYLTTQRQQFALKEFIGNGRQNSRF